MLAKYNNNIYWGFDTEDNKFKIHRYSFKDGWQTEKNYSGTYYAKIVSKDELDDVFLVKFTAYIDNQKFTLMDLKNNKILIVSNDQVYAEEHGFISNHGIFEAYIPLELTSNIQMIYSSETNNTETITNLTIQEFIPLWNKYNVDIYY